MRRAEAAAAAFSGDPKAITTIRTAAETFRYGSFAEE
jgi:hypothetical protein